MSIPADNERLALHRFLTMRLAADALLGRLVNLRDLASANGDTQLEQHCLERIAYVSEAVELSNDDDILEQDAFRRSFAAELDHIEALS